MTLMVIIRYYNHRNFFRYFADAYLRLDEVKLWEPKLKLPYRVRGGRGIGATAQPIFVAYHCGRKDGSLLQRQSTANSFMTDT